MHATVLNLVLLLLLLVKASPSWGLSFSAQPFVEAAQSQKLWNDPQWIKLGHYEKNYRGFSSPFTIGFFLHPEGSLSPEKELLKTIEMFYSDEGKDLQCRYLARAQWLHRKLGVPKELQLPCVERQQWKKQLNVSSISVIFAASDMGNASSSFGHTFLKIRNPENAQNKDLIDYGINYAANADSSEGLFYALKGLMGFYNGQFAMLPYHQKIREYINLEGRDIWEYNLNFSAEEVDFLVNHLIEMEQARAPYYFFSDNCSYQILKTLEVVRPHMNLSEEFKYFVIPIDTVKKLTAQNGIVESRKYKKSLKTDYLESYSQLGALQKKALDSAVTKLTIPADYELNNQERALVFETAMKYYSLQAFTSSKDYEDEKYKLYVQRASLGQVTDEIKILNPEPPEKSHDSSAIYLGAGSGYTLFKFRNALHDLEQQDFGTVPFSQNEMGSLEFRSPDQNRHAYLSKLTLLNLINLNPITQLDKNFSWKFRGEIVNTQTGDDIYKPDFEGAGGFSFDLQLFERSRLAQFIAGRYWTMPDGNDTLSAGPELLFVSRITPNIGFSLDLTYFMQEHRSDFFRYRTKFNYTLMQNYDLQFTMENQIDRHVDYQTQFVLSFML